MTSYRPHGAASARTGTAVVAALAVLLAGCSGDLPEALSEQAFGVDVEIGDPKPSPVPVEADDEVAADDEAGPDAEDYPTELPEELPLRSGMELVDSSVEQTDDGTVVTIETVDAGDFDAAVLFYETELPAADWSVVDNVEGDDPGTPTERWEIEGFGWTGFVEVQQEGQPNAIGGTTTRVLVELRTTE